MVQRPLLSLHNLNPNQVNLIPSMLSLNRIRLNHRSILLNLKASLLKVHPILINPNLSLPNPNPILSLNLNNLNKFSLVILHRHLLIQMSSLVHLSRFIIGMMMKMMMTNLWRNLLYLTNKQLIQFNNLLVLFLILLSLNPPTAKLMVQRIQMVRLMMMIMTMRMTVMIMMTTESKYNL